MMIKELLASLPKELNELLMYAFENDISKVVDLDNNYWIAVNQIKNSKLRVLETAGSFTYGEYF